MVQEEKDLLFKELSARHPYGVKLQVRLDYSDNEHKEGTYDADIEAITSYSIECTYYDTNIHGKIRDWTFRYEEVKPYLRSMSSMTKEEKKELERLIDEKLNGKIGQENDEWVPWVLHDTTGIKNFIGGERFYFDEMSFIYDWLNAHHFDYRGLIKRGLAIEATEENNPYEN